MSLTSKKYVRMNIVKLKLYICVVMIHDQGQERLEWPFGGFALRHSSPSSCGTSAPFADKKFTGDRAAGWLLRWL